jgi:hypothetical protein
MGPGSIAQANGWREPAMCQRSVGVVESYWNMAQWLMPNLQILRYGLATPARQTVSWGCCTISVPSAWVVTPAVAEERRLKVGYRIA